MNIEAAEDGRMLKTSKRRSPVIKIIIGTATIVAFILLYVAGTSEPFTMLRHHHISNTIPEIDTVLGLKTIISPNGVKLRYKEPGKEGICETTPGVNSYSGYIDLAEDLHTFFWFFEARTNAETAPITLWRKSSAFWPRWLISSKLTMF